MWLMWRFPTKTCGSHEAHVWLMYMMRKWLKKAMFQRICPKDQLSAARSLWQTQFKILSKHHLSAARSLWQTQSKILSKHHLSAARSLWQT